MSAGQGPLPNSYWSPGGLEWLRDEGRNKEKGRNGEQCCAYCCGWKRAAEHLVGFLEEERTHEKGNQDLHFLCQPTRCR